MGLLVSILLIFAHPRWTTVDEFGEAIGIGDEGGFAPPIAHPHEALDLLDAAVEQCGYTGKFKYGIDPASSEFLRGEKYDLGFKDAQERLYTREDMSSVYANLISKYPVVLLEDPYAQDDWEAWEMENRKCSIELVGDDLLATNVKRLKIADERKACNSMLLKINQIGTITEAIKA